MYQEEIERNAARFEEEMYKSDADRDTAQNDLRVALASISGLTTQASLETSILSFQELFLRPFLSVNFVLLIIVDFVRNFYLTLCLLFCFFFPNDNCSDLLKDNLLDLLLSTLLLYYFLFFPILSRTKYRFISGFLFRKKS
jgi:hypothetical protein